MPVSTWARRAAILTACLGATAFVGAGVASAATTVPGENIYGMGSSLQAIAETGQNAPGVASSGGACGSTGWPGWVSLWRCTPADHAGLSNNPTAFYTTEGSGQGLAEFGNASSGSCTSTTGVLSPACDPNANALGELDAYIGTDDPPNPTDLTNAATAAGGGVQEITVPIAQAPEAMIFSLPVGITLGSGATLNLPTLAFPYLWGSKGIPADSQCPAPSANTWCALLTHLGKQRITSGTPTASQFLDTTNNDGGKITLEERSKGSGTTYAFRGFLYEVDQDEGFTDYPYSLVTDGPSDWPTTAEPQSQTGPLGANGSNATMVENTCETPGSTSYPNLADAALDPVQPFSDTATTTTCGGTASHQVLYANVQDNFGDGKAPFYAKPNGSTTGSVNVYTGADISVNPSTCTPNSSARVVGCWVVPSTPTGSWGSTNSAAPGTIPSDPDVYDHGMSGTTPSTTYPIVATTYDVAWSQYDLAGTNLIGMYNDASCPSGTNCNTDAGNAVKNFLTYETGKGQSDLPFGKVYYTKVPAAIQSIASANVNAITP